MTARDAAGTSLRDLKLTLDAASRITRVEDLRPDVAAAESQSVTYTFDDRYRLTSAQDARATTTWKLDDTAKILSVESGHQAAWLNVTNTYGENGAGPDQLTHHGSEALLYDQAGRVTKDGERVLEWDAKGRVTRVTRGDVVEEYVYAYDDERVIKKTTKDGSTTTVRYVDQDVEERGGKIVRYIFVGDQRVARLDGSAGMRRHRQCPAYHRADAVLRAPSLDSRLFELPPAAVARTRCFARSRTGGRGFGGCLTRGRPKIANRGSHGARRCACR